MLGTYLFGLREGLEAGLIVFVLVAYLAGSGRRNAAGPVLAGAGAAVGVFLSFGAALEFGSRELTPEARELIGGSLSIAAAALVTWTVFRIRRAALRGTGDGTLDAGAGDAALGSKAEGPALGAGTGAGDAALGSKAEGPALGAGAGSSAFGRGGAALGAGAGVPAVTAFLAVGREGPETALFVWASVRATSPSGAGGSFEPLTWVLLGLLTAVLLGLLLHRVAVRTGPAGLLTRTGGALLVMTAGVLASGVRDLQDARLLGGLADTAFDVSSAVPPDGWSGTFLGGAFAFQPDPTVLQVTVWALYLVPALALFLSPIGSGPSARVKKQKATDEQAEGGASAGTTA
ncbi:MULTISPECIES: FTR1 family protein [unclassified Streptomyces]|uniref:FTR1 family iron permease n=1 Tax=unclassified Streptomyces TaxID=2593676 RepID=UPI0035DF2892